MNHDPLLPLRVSPDMYSPNLTTGWQCPGGRRPAAGALSCCDRTRVGRSLRPPRFWHLRARLRPTPGLPDPGPAFGLLGRRPQRHRYRPASQFGESVTDAAADAPFSGHLPRVGYSLGDRKFFKWKHHRGVEVSKSALDVSCPVAKASAAAFISDCAWARVTAARAVASPVCAEVASVNVPTPCA